MCPTSSRHVRCGSDSSRIGALQRFDEEGRFCCKSLFALVIKISFGCTHDFRVKMWGTSLREDKLAGDLGNVIECARQSWCDPAGASPAQVRSSVRLVASVAGPLATVVAKRTQRLHGVWD